MRIMAMPLAMRRGKGSRLWGGLSFRHPLSARRARTKDPFRLMLWNSMEATTFSPSAADFPSKNITSKKSARTASVSCDNGHPNPLARQKLANFDWYWWYWCWTSDEIDFISRKVIFWFWALLPKSSTSIFTFWTERRGFGWHGLKDSIDGSTLMDLDLLVTAMGLSSFLRVSRFQNLLLLRWLTLELVGPCKYPAGSDLAMARLRHWVQMVATLNGYLWTPLTKVLRTADKCEGVWKT